MSSLEDIGFWSFIARDTVGAVAVSSSEMWIGGALALGAVVGAVYAYPKPFLEVSHIPWTSREFDWKLPHAKMLSGFCTVRTSTTRPFWPKMPEGDCQGTHLTRSDLARTTRGS